MILGLGVIIWAVANDLILEMKGDILFKHQKMDFKMKTFASAVKQGIQLNY